MKYRQMLGYAFKYWSKETVLANLKSDNRTIRRISQYIVKCKFS